jgi:hypothetical protein
LTGIGSLNNLSVVHASEVCNPFYFSIPYEQLEELVTDHSYSFFEEADHCLNLKRLKIEQFSEDLIMWKASSESLKKLEALSIHGISAELILQEW